MEGRGKSTSCSGRRRPRSATCLVAYRHRVVFILGMVYLSHELPGRLAQAALPLDGERQMSTANAKCTARIVLESTLSQH